MIISLSLVALGGAIGASLRWVTGTLLLRVLGPSDFPLSIILVNVLGSLLMGFFVVVAAQRGLTYFNPFALTGLLGSFTTFSAFSLETMSMIERGQIWQAGVYILLSVFLSIGALAGGLFLARQVLT
tara:strand:- start:31 stop:411 length:381 start_codon:yes stop_codon:yes gene_type:complete